MWNVYIKIKYYFLQREPLNTFNIYTLKPPTFIDVYFEKGTAQPSQTKHTMAKG